MQQLGYDLRRLRIALGPLPKLSLISFLGHAGITLLFRQSKSRTRQTTCKQALVCKCGAIRFDKCCNGIPAAAAASSASGQARAACPLHHPYSAKPWSAVLQEVRATRSHHRSLKVGFICK